MRSFKQFLITETDTQSATDMEGAIAAAANDEKFIISKNSKIDKNAPYKVIKFLKKNGISGKGVKLFGMFPVNPNKWGKYFKEGSRPSNPKTDITIGKNKISLKTGKARLTTGGPSEGQALLFNALEKSGIKPNDFIKKIQKEIESLPVNVTASVKGTTSALLKNEKDKLLLKARENMHKLTEDLKKLWSTGKNFQYYFTQEAMFGEIKFDKQIATATYILKTSFDGEHNELHSSTDKAYIQSIASQINPYVGIKSFSEKGKGGVKTGYYNYTGTIQLATESFHSIYSIENIINEEFQKLENRMLNEAFINLDEGFTDVLKSIYNKIKSIFQKIVIWLQEGWHNILEYLGLEAEVHFNNEVRW